MRREPSDVDETDHDQAVLLFGPVWFGAER